MRPLALCFATAVGLTAADIPPSEILNYAVEWRLVRAGSVVVETKPSEAALKLESAGLVSALYRIQDQYRVRYEDSFCAVSSEMDAKESSRHRDTRITFDRMLNRAFFIERDVKKNAVVRKTDIEIPNCVHDVVGALRKMRRTDVAVGQSVQFPVSDGRKSAAVKVEALEREKVKTAAGSFDTIRYEVHLLNGVVYQRKGRVFLWVSQDDRRLPVRFQLRLGFPLGTVTVNLEKAGLPGEPVEGQ